MSNIAENVTNLPVRQEAPKPPIVAGAKMAAIVPSNFDEVWRLSLAIETSGFAPKGMDKAEKIMVALMTGLEIGMPPMQAMQRIAVINGRPTIWGDGAMALVRASGALEFARERIEGDGDARVAVCEVKRRGEPEVVSRAFSIANAKTAGLWNKAGPWKEYPERMLQMRARAFALRDLFADVLGGMYLREEVSDADDAREATPAVAAPPPPPPPPPPVAVIAPPAPPAPPAAAAASGAAKDESWPDRLARLQKALAQATDDDGLQRAWDEIVEPVWNTLDILEQEDAQNAHRQRSRELEP